MNDAPPIRLGDYHRDTRRMERYLKAHGIDNVRLTWAVEGRWGIDLSDSSVTDLSWSAGIPIYELVINNTAVSDLSPLYTQKEMRWLEANNTEISDLSPISGFAALEGLEIENTKVADLTPLRNIEIMRLNIQGIPCSDLSAVPLEKLRSIEFSLDPSKRWKGVKRLRARKNLLVNRFMDNRASWAEYDHVYGPEQPECCTAPEKCTALPLPSPVFPDQTTEVLHRAGKGGQVTMSEKSVFFINEYGSFGRFYFQGIYSICLLLVLPLTAVSLRQCWRKATSKIPTATILLGLLWALMLMVSITYGSGAVYEIILGILNASIDTVEFAFICANSKYPLMVMLLLCHVYFVFFVMSLLVFRCRHSRVKGGTLEV